MKTEHKSDTVREARTAERHVYETADFITTTHPEVKNKTGMAVMQQAIDLRWDVITTVSLVSRALTIWSTQYLADEAKV